MESDEELKERVDAGIEDAVRARKLPATLEEAVLYAALGPGKRTRPVLCFRSCEAVGGRVEDALPAAVAIELVHAFSLVHDDLPAMDDDDMRRGRPTLHRHAGEAAAILAGDAMQSLAIEAISGDACDPRLSRELSRATTDMIAGQVLDTIGGFPSGQSDDERLRAIHRKKTGALLIAACRMGGISGGADAKQLGDLTVYAIAVGICFQAVDDLLDVTADAATLGKAVRKDAEAGKLTYPGVFGIDGTKERIREYRDEAVTAARQLGRPADRLAEMARRLAVRGA